MGGTLGAVLGGYVSDRLAKSRGTDARMWVLIVSQVWGEGRGGKGTWRRWDGKLRRREVEGSRGENGKKEKVKGGGERREEMLGKEKMRGERRRLTRGR